MARSTTHFKRPAQLIKQAIEPRAKREVISVLCHTLVVDLTRENVAIHSEFEQLLLVCSKGCSLRHNSIGSKFGAASIWGLKHETKLPMQKLELKCSGAYVRGGHNCGILW